MKTRTIIPLVLGVVVGGIAIKIVVDVVSNAQNSNRSEVVACVVAKMDIEFADEITSDKLTTVEWPKESLPAQYFSSIEELNGRVSDMYIPKDVPVYPSMLAPPGTPPGIQTRIKPGYRAVAVAIDEVTGVSYQVKPGDRVDVVAMVKKRTKSGSQQQSRIILKNVEVATVGRALSTNKKGEQVKSIARSITLLLKPDQVTQLHLAQSIGGRLALALRGSGDFEDADEAVDEESADNMEKQPKRPEAVVQHTANPVPQPTKRPEQVWSVNVISGNQIEQVQYRWDGGRWELKDGSEPATEPTPMPASFTRPRGLQENQQGGDFQSDSDEISSEES
jgi:pilus assembly protein CpaB